MFILWDQIRSYASGFFSFKIEETYTLTAFVNQILSFSVYSESMYRLHDSLGWLGFFKISDLPVI